MSMFCFWDCQWKQNKRTEGWHERHSWLTLALFIPYRTENQAKPVAITQQSPSCSIFLDDVNTCMTPAEKHMPGAMIPVPWEVVLSIYFRYKTFRAPINQSEWRLHVQLLIQFLILPSGQTLWGHLCVIHHYGLRTWHTVDVQQLLNEWMTQSADCVLSIDYIQVTINGHGRWKRSVRCMFPALIKLRHTPLLLLSKRKCRMEYCCPWVKTTKSVSLKSCPPSRDEKPSGRPQHVLMLGSLPSITVWNTCWSWAFSWCS